MNMGGIGRDTGASPTQLIKPVTDLAEKASKATKLKSLKLKLKFKDKKDGDSK